MSVGSAGDINGDGYDDIVIGAPFASSGDGSSYVLFGHSAAVTQTDANVALSTLDGSSNGFRLRGEAGNHAGLVVGSAGDVNGDGFDDLLISAPNAAPDGVNSGSVYVVFGKSTPIAASSFLSALDGSSGFRLDGSVANAYAGGHAAGVGDVNGDGFDDLLVSVVANGVNASASAYLVFGHGGAFNASTDLGSLSSAQALRIDGIAIGASGSLFGTVAAAGDVNGDGYDDMLLGAPHALANGLTDAGAAYVVMGRDFTNSGVIEGGSGNNTLQATAVDQHMVGGAGNDSLLGLGGAAVLNGGAGNDTLDGGGGTATLVGGYGDDLLKFHGGELRVDGGNGVDTLSFRRRRHQSRSHHLTDESRRPFRTHRSDRRRRRRQFPDPQHPRRLRAARSTGAMGSQRPALRAAAYRWRRR